MAILYGGTDGLHTDAFHVELIKYGRGPRSTNAHPIWRYPWAGFILMHFKLVAEKGIHMTSMGIAKNDSC